MRSSPSGPGLDSISTTFNSGELRVETLDISGLLAFSTRLVPYGVSENVPRGGRFQSEQNRCSYNKSERPARWGKSPEGGCDNEPVHEVPGRFGLKSGISLRDTENESLSRMLSDLRVGQMRDSDRKAK